MDTQLIICNVNVDIDVKFNFTNLMNPILVMEANESFVRSMSSIFQVVKSFPLSLSFPRSFIESSCCVDDFEK